MLSRPCADIAAAVTEWNRLVAAGLFDPELDTFVIHTEAPSLAEVL